MARFLFNANEVCKSVPIQREEAAFTQTTIGPNYPAIADQPQGFPAASANDTASAAAAKPMLAVTITEEP